MRLKTIPEDFVVREATDLRIRKQPAPYRVYLLEKTGWNTVDALTRIAKEHRVPYARFAYGGKKDRHAHTIQYVTVEHTPKDLSLTTKGYSFKLLGYSTDPMGPSRILANHFELTVRELKPDEETRLMRSQGRAKEQGVVNYFDDQRFGNLDRERGMIGEKMLQGKWEDALNMALTSIYSEEAKEAKERKRALREQWGDWEACRKLAVTAFEQRAFDMLRERPRAFREALATVHKETAAMWVSTYQSWLWNEVLRRYLERKGWAGPSAPGVAGAYVFATPEAQLDDLVIPLPGRNMRFHDLEPGPGIILEELLAERRLRPISLEAELLPGLGMNASPRPAIVKAQSIYADAPQPDDRYPGHSKVTVRFALPRGSYATMLIKGMMA